MGVRIKSGQVTKYYDSIGGYKQTRALVRRKSDSEERAQGVVTIRVETETTVPSAVGARRQKVSRSPKAVVTFVRSQAVRCFGAPWPSKRTEHRPQVNCGIPAHAAGGSRDAASLAE